MTEEAETPEKKGNCACPCVRWHAPKPTKMFEMAGRELCPVSAHAVGDLLEKQRAAGKWVKKNEAGFTKFQKDIAREIFASEGGVEEEPVAETPDPEASAEVEPAGEAEVQGDTTAEEATGETAEQLA